MKLNDFYDFIESDPKNQYGLVCLILLLITIIGVAIEYFLHK